MQHYCTLGPHVGFLLRFPHGVLNTELNPVEDVALKQNGERATIPPVRRGGPTRFFFLNKNDLLLYTVYLFINLLSSRDTGISDAPL